MHTYLEKFNPNQFGFRQNCATSEAVRQLYDYFLESLDKKKITCSVFIDLAKVFDTVDHEILLNEFHYSLSKATSLIDIKIRW